MGWLSGTALGRGLIALHIHLTSYWLELLSAYTAYTYTRFSNEACLGKFNLAPCGSKNLLTS